MTRQNFSLQNLLREFNPLVIAQLTQWFSRISPGISTTIGLAIVAYFLRTLPGLDLFSPLILAIVLGICIRNTVGIPNLCQPGVTFALRRLLRFAIILLGLQLSLFQVMAIGVNGLALITITLFTTFGFTCWMGRQLGIRENLTYLIATGTSICGASAVAATSAAIESSDEDTIYAVAIVTVFGTLSMLLYPLLMTSLNLSSETFGIWCGASIHEVAQALAAAFQVSSVSGEVASIAKLSRVLWLAPMVLWIGSLKKNLSSSSAKFDSQTIAIPWFAIHFMVLILLNSSNIFPIGLKSVIEQINQFLLTMAMAAMGLETKLKHIKQVGLKPLYLAALSWLFITVFSYELIQILY